MTARRPMVIRNRLKRCTRRKKWIPQCNVGPEKGKNLVHVRKKWLPGILQLSPFAYVYSVFSYFWVPLRFQVLPFFDVYAVSCENQWFLKYFWVFEKFFKKYFKNISNRLWKTFQIRFLEDFQTLSSGWVRTPPPRIWLCDQCCIAVSRRSEVGGDPAD